MIKKLISLIILISFFSYGEPPGEAPLPVTPKIGTVETEENDINRAQGSTEILFDEKNSFHSLIEKNNEAIELLSANQKTLTEQIINSKIDTSEINYSTWASILLACVTVIITILSVILAIISIVGYRNFKKSIELNVRNISTTVAKKETSILIDEVAKKELTRLINEGALAKHLEDAVDMIFLRMKDRESKNGFDKYPEIDIEKEDVE
ncbi:TPA: hypothetical protein RG728_001579 [Morganella morganii subsp. morganii]|uniref:Uncharacterized protein n=1 Tax=Morganella morganii TaxID=582 RepID=A0AAU8ZLG2_MORMO|nr:hypothetical protein [Morganella morganii]AWC93611.1 hypothetical protein AM380_08210 [Morganella morganii]EKW8486856.1 hypothetical protein [Morganella morganii]HDU8692485.1 hypothetical protein [Morganella morganii subsp. morganii]